MRKSKQLCTPHSSTWWEKRKKAREELRSVRYTTPHTGVPRSQEYAYKGTSPIRNNPPLVP
jgi:hypothetical protein